MDMKEKASELAYGVAKATISSVPVAGGYLAELFGMVVTDPATKRRERIVDAIATKLGEIQKKVDGLDLGSLAQNEVFLTNVMQAIHIAMRTHQQEKLDALLNAIVSSALDSSVDDNLQQMFLMFIDGLTEWHLRLLFFFDNPQNGVDVGSGGMSSISSYLESRFPLLKSKDEFYRQVIRDLDSRGLTNVGGALNTTMTSTGVFASRTTMLGKQFIRFISPKL